MYRPLLGGLWMSILLVACGTSEHATIRPSYKVAAIEASRYEISAELDQHPDAQAVAVLAPYKKKIDDTMFEVIGESTQAMKAHQPESLLSNLIADILREATLPYIGRTADMGLVNMGGIRSSLPQGNLTNGHIFEILPFENSLCIVRLKGNVLKQLMNELAAENGEGVSNIHLEIQNRKLVSATIGGKAIDDNQFYEVATIDYLAEGNSGMKALTQCENKICPDGLTLRDIVINYIKTQTAQGKKIQSQVDGRITLIK